MRYRVSLTEKQWEMVLSCLSYANAGEISGTPLCDDHEESAGTKRLLRAWNGAYLAVEHATRER